MTTMCMQFHTPKQVSSFVNIVNRYPCRVGMTQGRYKIDAKSILGIFSLDLSRPVTVEILAERCDPLLRELNGLQSAS